MSSKSAIKTLVPADAESALFRWVALLTGSKNALKGAGFFLGGLLLSTLGFRASLWSMAAGLALILLLAVLQLPAAMGKARGKAKLGSLLAQQRDINVLSGARFFLFGARDIWFVVGVPVFLARHLGWGFTEVGTFLALWVIGYGVIQAGAPAMLKAFTQGRAPRARSAQLLALALFVATALVPTSRLAGVAPTTAVLAGLGLFGVVFAVNSAVHSYLILAYSDADKVALNVGFYYMANAGGRLVGTLLSGLVYQWAGLPGCLWFSAAFALASAALALLLHDPVRELDLSRVKLEGGE